MSVEMHVFACRIHLLMNMDPAAGQVLHTLDETIVEGNNPYSLSLDESGTDS